MKTTHIFKDQRTCQDIGNPSHFWVMVILLQCVSDFSIITKQFLSVINSNRWPRLLAMIILTFGALL